MIEPILTEDIELCQKCNYHFVEMLICHNRNFLITEAKKRELIKKELTFYFYAMGRYN